MNKILFILAVILITCSPEKNAQQVESHTWELIAKKAAFRYYLVNTDYVWLIWRSLNTGIEYWEYVEKEKAYFFIVGMKISNRDKR